jgi:hypothetical protein
MVDGEERSNGDVYLDRHCVSCGYVRLAGQDLIVPEEVYANHYEHLPGRKCTSVSGCSDLCLLEHIMAVYDGCEDEFNEVLEDVWSDRPVPFSRKER